MVNRGYWQIKSNQRKFFDQLAFKLGIKNPSEWGTISRKILLEHGGGSILTINKGSFKVALKTAYPEINWKNEWFSTPIGHWQQMDVQKDFLNSLAKRLGVTKPEDWGNISIYEVNKYGGSSLLNHFGGSLQKALKTLFPDIEWKPEWFRTPIGYWGNKKNQRDFFDSIAIKLQIFHPSQWGNVTNQLFIENGGRGLLILHGGSLWKALHAVYPEILWKREWFQNLPKYSQAHFDNKGNQKSFLFEIADRHNILNSTDWKLVSSSLIKMNGGLGLLRKYSGSLSLALKVLFPKENWKYRIEHTKFSRPQEFVEEKLGKIFKEIN